MNKPTPTKTAPSSAKARPQKGRRPQKKISTTRTYVSWAVALMVGVMFAVLMTLITDARRHSFYGEPLWQKVAERATFRLHGLPEGNEARARFISGIPNLYLLPAEAVLAPEIAQRFQKLNIQFAYVPEDVRPGNGRYRCNTTDVALIPNVAWNIAAALYPIPDEVLRGLDLKYIVFCGDLFQEKVKVGGFPVPINDLIILNLTHRTENHDIQEFFLHEFYHLFESRHKLVKDVAWDQKFGVGYRNSYEGHNSRAPSPLGSGTYGFINRYSESFPYEDRAEIFAMLMTAQLSLLQLIRQQQDELLYMKAKYVADTMRHKMGIQVSPF